MVANVVKIGNSHYVLLAKKMLDSYALADQVEIEYKEGYILIKPHRNPRAGWSDLYTKSFREDGYEELLIPGEFGDESLPIYED